MLFVALNELIKDFVNECLSDSFDIGSEEAKSELQETARKIDEIGSNISITKAYG